MFRDGSVPVTGKARNLGLYLALWGVERQLPGGVGAGGVPILLGVGELGLRLGALQAVLFRSGRAGAI